MCSDYLYVLYANGGCIATGTVKDDGLTYTPSKQWADAHVFWSGTVEAGSHTAWLQSPQENLWGCNGKNWGDVNVVVFTPQGPFVCSFAMHAL